jgi:hypothetical protein
MSFGQATARENGPAAATQPIDGRLHDGPCVTADRLADGDAQWQQSFSLA